MRIKNLWRITNNSKEDAWVWIFAAGDTAKWGVLDGKLFKLEKGQTKETDIGPNKVQIGFRKGDTLFAGWVAEPYEVETNYDIQLTKENKIARSNNVVFDWVEKAKDVEFLGPVQRNDLARQAAVWGLGKIPQVGGFISGIVGFLWKEQKPKVDDLIDASEKRMKSWVRGEIDKIKRDQLRKFYEGLQNNIYEYTAAKDPSSRLYWLRTNIAHCNKDMPFFTSRDYTTGTIDLGVEVATIHIGLLRERVLYADDLGIPEADRPGHVETLERTVDAYQDFVLNTAIPAEQRWRKEAIDASKIEGIMGYNGYYLRDTAVRQTYYFADETLGYSRNTAHSIVNNNYYLRQANNSYANALRSNIEDAARMWTMLKVAPETSQPIPMDRVTWVGPCSGLIYKKGNEHAAEEKVRLTARGEIAEITVRAHDEVDYIKITFRDGTSKAIGNPGGGTPYTVTLPEGVYITEAETWWDWELVGMRFKLSDGTQTPQIGNKSKMGRHYQFASLDNHVLSGIQVEGKPDARIGNGISFGFTLHPDFYKESV